MRVAIAGGGPGGLYAAILLRAIGAQVTLWERNAPDDTFGFGVVFSDETLVAFESADRDSYDRISTAFVRWSDIDVHYRGEVMRSGGHGFSALGRVELLTILQQRAGELGAQLRFRAAVPPIADLASRYDLVIAADGVNSATREDRAGAFVPSVERGLARYMWLGTDRVFDAFQFFIVETEHGVFQIHAYPYDATMSTFIVETDPMTWDAAGLASGAAREFAPGESDEEAIAFCRDAFAEALSGHRLLGNNSRWLTFPTVRNEHWHDGNIVLIGDAAHTAHFSIGSGTKLAMEDAIALAAAIGVHPDDVPSALTAYEEERRPVVESTQRAARGSREWFEGIGRYMGQPPLQFAFNLLTRSRRITYDNLRLRDAGFVAAVEREFEGERPGIDRGGAVAGRSRPRSGGPPMFHPFRLRELELPNRVVVSPMDMYSAVDGVVGDFHLVHLGSRGIGGAGLVMSEMLCVSEIGRITPGCAGLWRDDQLPGWKRIVDFVHAHSNARIGAQLGHSGRKGATQLMWEAVDRPLPSGGWPLIAPSPLPYFSDSQVPREMTRADMDFVRDEYVAATERAVEGGFDLLELHMAHGYLLSSFISPLTNRREDEYGGDLQSRARYPIEVLDACRAAWPAELPLSVRISATDWHPDGCTGDDAVALAPMLAAHGADVIDVSTGQVTPDARPLFGRSFQTPFADRIRHETGIPTIAVGAISSHEDVNTIILAGRADLCALARPHLYDPHWTLHAAAELEYPDADWIVQYQAGSRRPPSGRG